MAASLVTLLKAIPLASWKAKIEEIAEDVGLETENWADGGFTKTLIAIFARLYTTASDVIRLIAAAGFLDYAEGEWLTLLAKNVFGLDRIEATYAAAVEGIKLTNTGGGLYVLDAGDVIVAHESSEKTYTTTSGGTLSPGVGNILRLDVIADEPGSDSNAAVGTITELITTNLGVTVTNEVSLAGLDAESDEALRQRCRDSLAALSIGGIKKAYEFYAKSAVRDDGTSVGVTRVRVMPAVGDGTLTVYIAGASGAISGPDVAVVQSVFDLQVTPYGLDAIAVSATNKSIDPPSTIWIPSELGLSTGDAQTIVAAALEEYVQTLPIGGVIIPPTAGRVYWRALLGIVSNAIEGTLKAQMFSEADITIADGEVPIWAGASGDVTVNQVS